MWCCLEGSCLPAVSICWWVRQASLWHLSMLCQLCWWDATGFLSAWQPCLILRRASRTLWETQSPCVTSEVKYDLKDWAPSGHKPFYFLSHWKTWQRKFGIQLRISTRLRWPADNKVWNRSAVSCNVASRNRNILHIRSHQEYFKRTGRLLGLQNIILLISYISFFLSFLPCRVFHWLDSADFFFPLGFVLLLVLVNFLMLFIYIWEQERNLHFFLCFASFWN